MITLKTNFRNMFDCLLQYRVVRLFTAVQSYSIVYCSTELFDCLPQYRVVRLFTAVQSWSM